jgi:hypothetical protein
LEEGYPPDDPSPCRATQILTVILGFQGRNDEAARHLGAAEQAIRGRDDEEYLRSRRQNAWVMGDSLFADDPDEEIARGRLAMSLAQHSGNPTNLAAASFALGKALRHRDEALAAFEQVVALAQRGASGALAGSAVLRGAAGRSARRRWRRESQAHGGPRTGPSRWGGRYPGT